MTADEAIAKGYRIHFKVWAKIEAALWLEGEGEGDIDHYQPDNLEAAVLVGDAAEALTWVNEHSTDGGVTGDDQWLERLAWFAFEDVIEEKEKQRDTRRVGTNQG